MAEDIELGVGAMIARLEEQKAALEAAIEALKRLEAAGGGVAGMQGVRSTPHSSQEIHRDTFVGMSIAEAAQKYLQIVGRPARATEAIVDALLRGGLQRVSPASVATILSRIHNSDGPIVRVQKGLWGLAEWYPKRPPRVGRRGNVNGGETEDTEPKRRGRGRRVRRARATRRPKLEKVERAEKLEAASA